MSAVEHWPDARQLAMKLTDTGLENEEAFEWVREVQAAAWEEGFTASYEWIEQNPPPSGIWSDPPLNPYEKES